MTTLLLPVEFPNSEGRLAEFGYGMCFAGPDDIVRWLVVLHDKAHRFYEVTCETEVAADIYIAELKFAIAEDGLATFV